jgi:hypothetical protein
MKIVVNNVSSKVNIKVMNKYHYMGIQWDNTAASYLILLGNKYFTILSLDLLPVKACLNKTNSKVQIHVCKYFSDVFFILNDL